MVTAKSFKALKRFCAGKDTEKTAAFLDRMHSIDDLRKMRIIASADTITDLAKWLTDTDNSTKCAFIDNNINRI